MKIVYTGSIFYNQRYGGISRYFTQLVKNINVDCKIVAPINKNLYLKNVTKNQKYSFYFNKLPNYNILKNLNNFLSNKIIEKYYPNIVHETYYSKNIKNLSRYKRILTIYDLIHEKFKEDYPLKKLNEKKGILSEIDHFICISNQTKKDFLNYYNIEENKVSVVHLGLNHLTNNFHEKKISINKPYILYIGSRYKYKNFNILLDSLNKIKTKNILLVCFGGEKFTKNELKKNKSNIQIKHLYGNDNLLYTLIKNAECLVNTSSYEGFSLPNLEAMSLGCPLICSNIPIFKEICDTSPMYFNINDNEFLAHCIDETINNKKIKNQIITNGINRSKLFTWEKCSEKI